MDTQPKQPDDTTVFIPANEIRYIECALNKLEKAQQEFCKVSILMKSPDNNSDLTIQGK
ncbi:MAG: hypothetical protein LBO69_04655 [Ignavibacteria bacterium]|jgi:hypothetical protein|nr:hypothetical protein [Ignavibacteria bacterium]